MVRVLFIFLLFRSAVTFVGKVSNGRQRCIKDAFHCELESFLPSCPQTFGGNMVKVVLEPGKNETRRASLVIVTSSSGKDLCWSTTTESQRPHARICNILLTVLGGYSGLRTPVGGNGCESWRCPSFALHADCRVFNIARVALTLERGKFCSTTFHTSTASADSLILLLTTPTTSHRRACSRATS